MKKILLSTLAILAIGNSSLHAEGNGLYLGVGYSSTNIDLSIPSTLYEDNILDEATDSVLFMAGYDFNEYVGIEVRYSINSSSLAFDYYLSDTPLEGTYEAETLAFYVKPQYNFGLITVYGLLGVAMNDYTANTLLGAEDETLFSWGAGAKFNITESFGAFVDYTDLGETDEIITTALTSWNVGLSYKF